ncbi:hypothetical protein [Microbacterium terregens]|uniref:Glycosyltransferase RgtA/B/C/D-like domain-containing protein n=1 Tax=Microbacterium terregens TaxID=69363 RepID=A0ABV5SZM3_9MICO
MPDDAGAARRFPHTLVAGLVVFALQWVHGPAQAFLYDAVQYWGAPIALLTGGNVSDAGVLQIRGVLSSIVYLPPALATTILGPSTAVWTVLVWNSLLASVICVILLPRIAGLITPGGLVIRIWFSALAGGVVLSGFARYPHLDVWSAGLALAGFLGLASSRRWWTIALSGLSLAVALNLRPSYLAPVAIAAVVLLIARPRLVLWAVPGAAVGLLPQFVFNITTLSSLSLSPVATSYLLQVQSAQAAFAVRYDTVAFADRHPQQWYCDPAYARLLAGDVEPTSPVGVLSSAISHLPHSLWFFSQKAGASLQWSFATPMEHPPGGGTSLMTFVVVGLSAFGVVALIWQAVTLRAQRGPLLNALALVGFWIGALGTLVLSTPETRFALPLVLVGIVGLLTVLPPTLRPTAPRAAIVAALVVAVALAVGVFAIGKAGLAHPLPPGPLTSETQCAAMDAERGE